MNENIYVKNLQARIELIEEALAAAAGGDLEVQLPIDIDDADELMSVETGINLLISDLRDEVSARRRLAQELAECRNTQSSQG